MALKIEGVVDGGVHAEKPLSGASRLEPLHFVVSSSHRLMLSTDVQNWTLSDIENWTPGLK